MTPLAYQAMIRFALPLSFACLVCLAIAGWLVAAEPADNAPTERDSEQIRHEVRGLLADLDSDDYARRVAAAKQLDALIAESQWNEFLAKEFHRALLRADISFEVRWRLQRWCETLPEVVPEDVGNLSIEQLDELLGQLDADSYAVRQAALQRLRWLAMRDEHLPRVKRAVLAALAAEPPRTASESLRKLADWLRPGLVAEYWQGRQHRNAQSLLVDVPSMSTGSIRPSHFDRIDDQTAHCVSGNNLTPGDYPVGVAFPHPNQPDAFFRLVNLSTPSRRHAYAREKQEDDAVRLAAISRRTLDRLLGRKRPLSGAELVMLANLAPAEVSRFAGNYLLQVEDAPVAIPVARYADFGRPSGHGMLCGILARIGTHEAADGLIKAIEENRILPPTSSAPYRLDRLAALAIASRDPWPDVDAWLAEQLDEELPLIEGDSDGPELAATACAVLLRRRDRDPVAFGLERTVHPRFDDVGLKTYRFPHQRLREKAKGLAGDG